MSKRKKQRPASRKIPTQHFGDAIACILVEDPSDPNPEYKISSAFFETTVICDIDLMRGFRLGYPDAVKHTFELIAPANAWGIFMGETMTACKLITEQGNILDAGDSVEIHFLA